ncbi:MAG: hypothetical protein H0X37_18935 [Herpetosiphonaceae bacterium]|nr:hypothetical protein [Herpetosiphonaceae bacterium]
MAETEHLTGDKREKSLLSQRITRREFLGTATCGLAGLMVPHGSMMLRPEPTDVPDLLVPWRDSIGWGYRASAETTYQQMITDMTVIKAAGGNTVWLTHGNPGWEVNPRADEAGISLKDYVAVVNNTAEAPQANLQFDVVHLALEAAGLVGLRVVLSTGYQTCAGRWWSERYPNDLRRAKDGSNPIRKGWGDATIWNAAFDSVRYRELLQNYAAFLKQGVIDQHPGTQIVAIVNADEPNIVDYSDHAVATFKQQYGLTMAQAVHTDPYLIGLFQHQSWGRFGAWMANLWQQVDPRLWNLNTFHFERTAPWFPGIGAIFEMAPRNMAISFDSHPQDTSMTDRFSRDHLYMLNILARTVAFHASVQGRGNQQYSTVPLMLWAGANRWSLNWAPGEDEAGHATVQDAVDTMYAVVRETKRVGGDIAAMLAWHFNIPSQRLPDDVQHVAFDTINAALGRIGPTLSDHAEQPEAPSIILSYDEHAMLTRIGRLATFDLYDSATLPQLLRRHHLSLETLAMANSVILPKDSYAYEVAMNMGSNAREIALF